MSNGDETTGRTHPLLHPRVVSGVALTVTIATIAILAVNLHRNGHTQGDDFALYLRQARSLFDGDTAAVVADNRWSVLYSDFPFSPIAYPWGWPILLSPFVEVWGLDFARLKLIEVASLCAFLVLLHGIVRRRLGRIAALAVVAVIGTAPAYAAHTDQLLSELPYFVTVAVFVWWLDRVRARSTLLDASVRDLVTLGVLVVVAFNVRREGVVLIGVILGMQCVDLLRAGPRTIAPTVRREWRTIGLPYLSALAAGVLFQLLLPTAVRPDNGNDPSYLIDRWGEFPSTLSRQLGFGEHGWVGALVLALAVVGVVVGLRVRPALDAPLVLLAVFSAVVIGTHLREVERYWLQVTPWVLYFATSALVALGRWALPRRQGLGSAIAVVPLAVLVASHLSVLRGDIADADRFNAAGRQQSGPTSIAVAPIFDAVAVHTPPDAVIAYPRARTMTLLTDRRAVQTRHEDKVLAYADFWAQRKGSTYWQPDIDAFAAERLGMVEVWSDENWILWELPER